MNPQLLPLIQLQTLDLRAVEIREQRGRIPELLEAAERPLREAKQHLQKATTSAETAVKARRDRERDLETQEAQIQKLKARATEIKKNAEYQAHLFEVQMANKKKGEVEEQILVLMEEVEQNHQVVQEATAKVAEAEVLLATKKATLEVQDTKAAVELTDLDRKQQALAKSLDKALVDRYNKLKTTRKDLAVAPVRDGTCSGCRLQLAPQLVAEVKRSEELLACSYCHRILYWEGEFSQAGGTVSESLDKAAQNLPEPV